MNKLKLVTDGVVHGARVLDESGECVGFIDEVVIQARTPLTVVKLGAKGRPVTTEELDQFRKIFEMAKTEEPFTLFTDNEVEIETFYPRGSVEIVAKLEGK